MFRTIKRLHRLEVCYSPEILASETNKPEEMVDEIMID